MRWPATITVMSVCVGPPVTSITLTWVKAIVVSAAAAARIARLKATMVIWEKIRDIICMRERKEVFVIRCPRPPESRQKDVGGLRLDLMATPERLPEGMTLIRMVISPATPASENGALHATLKRWSTQNWVVPLHSKAEFFSSC